MERESTFLVFRPLEDIMADGRLRVRRELNPRNK